MRNAIKDILDLSYTPTWAELLTDFAGAFACLALPALLALVAVAFGWGIP